MRAEGDDLVLLVHRYHMIEEMLPRMMKESNNFYAESLFYQLGASNDAPFASGRRSTEKVYDFIRQIGMNPAEYSVADGSGLSLYNYLTPQLVVRLLRWAWANKEIYESLNATLPISGVDGTLKKRMIHTPAYGKVHAKTGTLRKVSTLAGYTKASNNTNLAFCIFNQGIQTGAEGKAFQDEVCNVLVR